MRFNTIVLAILICFVLMSFQKLNKLEVLLSKATTVEQILTIKTMFDSEKNLEIFNNIPVGISPLNPDKLKRVSSSFGDRFHPISGQYKKHLGLDISANENLAIHTTANGTVTSVVYSNKGYGNYVLITHKYGFVTKYAHLNVITVAKGQEVKVGSIIGGVGTTGSSTGNHLHYEIIKNKSHINPEKLI